MVGAVTVLISIVAVFLAYNANQGLPFVPTYRVSVEVPNSARLRDSNEIRIGGTRVGAVETIEPVVDAGQTATAQSGDPEQAGELAPVVAQINLKLDESAKPIPQDSIFRVRYRSPFGLKYLEIVRGTGPAAPEGFHFDGTDDGAICELPTDPKTFTGSIPEQARNGCFQAQTEFDAINDTFDTKTRKAQRENLLGYGNAFASRGTSLNDTIAELDPLFTNLRPVARALADPETGLGRFFNGLARTAQYTAPAASDYAQQFVNAAIAFRAISSDPEALKDSISEAPPTYETGIRLLPAQRAFLARGRDLRARDAPVGGEPARDAARPERDPGDRRPGDARPATREPPASGGLRRAGRAGLPALDADHADAPRRHRSAQPSRSPSTSCRRRPSATTSTTGSPSCPGA